MDFKIPDKFRIAGIEITIVWEKNLGANTMSRGEAHHFTRVIKLDPDLSAEQKRETFMHEVCHHVGSILDIGLKETQVKRLAVGIADVIRQVEV